MGNIVDFDKAKKAKDNKVAEASKRKQKNKKLAEKRRRFDNRKKIKPIHFYLALLVIITIVVLLFFR